jgi:hypothetical protein
MVVRQTERMKEDTSMSTGKASPSRSTSVRGTWEYRLIFLVSYPIFVVFEIADRVVHLGREVSDARSRKSVFAAARESANTSLPYAFHG